MGEENDVQTMMSTVTVMQSSFSVRRWTATWYFAASVQGQMNVSMTCLPSKYNQRICLSLFGYAGKGSGQ
jgi:hypothetical protein